MKLESALQLKEKFKAQFQAEHLTPAGATAVYEALSGDNRIKANAAVLPIDQRLSVGLSKDTKRTDSYRIELRVQREGGRAHRAAQAFKQEARGEANIEVIPRIEAPSTSLAKLQVPRINPLQIGLSVSHRNGPTGTLGGFVMAEKGDAILSCAHVLAPESDDKHIFHPGSADATILRSMRIARLYEATEFIHQRTNNVDAAIALLLDDRLDHDGNVIPKTSSHALAGRRLEAVIGMDALAGRQAVGKVGRTTGVTTGRIRAIALDNIPIEMAGFGVLSFSNVIEVESTSSGKPFTLPGDSGSIVFTEDDLAPFGLHFAGTYADPEGIKISYACDLQTVLDNFSATWIL